MGAARISQDYTSPLGSVGDKLGEANGSCHDPAEAAPTRPRVVALGGGTGLPTLLRGLRTAMFSPGAQPASERDRACLTAIVTVADDGGSSGRLRQAYAVPSPGDVRNCLLALAEGQSAMAAIFGFRFDGTSDVGGHSLGNLILTALTRMNSGFLEALEQGGEILGIQGRVLPATLTNVILHAEFADGTEVQGESRIAVARRLIRRVSLRPARARALPEACEAIQAADLIVVGPGSLYTSLIATLLVDDLAEALAHARGRIALVMNLMTEPGETDGYTAADHLVAIRRHVRHLPIHYLLLNAAPIAESAVAYYGLRGAAPVAPDVELLRALGSVPVMRDLLGTGLTVRHDPHKLAGALLELAEEGAR